MTERLDRELVRRGLARSRTHAQAMINAGEVMVDGSVVERPGEQVAPSAAIHAPDDRFVSRRVRLQERVNLRDLRLEHVGGVPVDLAVADVSFISLRLLVGPLVSVTRDDGWVLLLVKPQFEVGRELLGKGGVVRTPEHQLQAISSVIDAAGEYGWSGVAAVASRLLGASGNREFFVLLRRTESAPDLDLTALVQT